MWKFINYHKVYHYFNMRLHRYMWVLWSMKITSFCMCSVPCINRCIWHYIFHAHVLIVYGFCRFKSDEERTPVNHVVEETFPHLLNIFSRLVQIANPSVEVADLIKLICKIFWSCIYVCPHPQVTNLFYMHIDSVSWFKQYQFFSRCFDHFFGVF